MTGTVIASEVASVIAPLCGPVLSAPVQSETGGPRPLAARAASGSAWLIAARMGTRAIDLATLMLLARLLTPADFGVVAVAMVLVQIVEAVFELPVAQVLVRAASPAHRTSGATGDDRAMLDPAFTLSVARGLVVAALLAAAALPFARAYHDGRLLGLICFLALAPALRGIASPRLALYARVLDFRRDCASDLVGKLCSFGVAVIPIGPLPPAPLPRRPLPRSPPLCWHRTAPGSLWCTGANSPVSSAGPAPRRCSAR